MRSSLLVQEEAFVEDQRIKEEKPLTMLVGVAERATVGRLEAVVTVTVAEEETDSPSSVEQVMS